MPARAAQTLPMRSARLLLVVCASAAAALPLLLLGCSSDGDDERAEADEPPCVKVIYSAADGGKSGDEACEPLPNECLNADKACGSSESPDCMRAIQALCKDGAEKQYCVASSLNDRLVSVELGCKLP